MSLCRVLPLLIGGLVFGSAAATERMLVKEITVRASLEDVWHAWTTEDGLRFVSEKSNVELRRGGSYEWFLHLPPDDNGQRGGEGARVLAFLPKEMLAFSWRFPPSIPALRYANETTQVVVTMNETGDGAVQVRLTAHEWQDGAAWDAGWAYFDNAWGNVLARLKAHLESTPGTTPRE
ncbi:MAG: SRPBCC domain-containing protein [Gammaproteobacteria bacterium]|nr:SRPBCC domain-containing protein [Gammaproteobacteria bacterium]